MTVSCSPVQRRRGPFGKVSDVLDGYEPVEYRGQVHRAFDELESAGEIAAPRRTGFIRRDDRDGERYARLTGVGRAAIDAGCTLGGTPE